MFSPRGPSRLLREELAVVRLNRVRREKRFHSSSSIAFSRRGTAALQVLPLVEEVAQGLARLLPVSLGGVLGDDGLGALNDTEVRSARAAALAACAGDFMRGGLRGRHRRSRSAGCRR